MDTTTSALTENMAQMPYNGPIPSPQSYTYYLQNPLQQPQQLGPLGQQQTLQMGPTGQLQTIQMGPTGQPQTTTYIYPQRPNVVGGCPYPFNPTPQASFEPYFG